MPPTEGVHNKTEKTFSLKSLRISDYNRIIVHIFSFNLQDMTLTNEHLQNRTFTKSAVLEFINLH